VTGLRWEDVDLSADLAEARKLPKGTPSIAILTTGWPWPERSTRGHRRVAAGAGCRTLPIPKPLVDALKSLKARQAAEQLVAGEAYAACPQCGGAHLVVNELGEPYRPEWYSHLFVSLGKTAGVSQVVLHGARQSAASLLADLGVPDIVAAAWLGHTQVQVTQGYQHVIVERLTEASKALGDALAG
jgi:integrase